MKRTFKNAPLNREFKQVQRLPLLASEPDGFRAGRAVQPASGGTPDGGLALADGGRGSAEIHPIQCTNSF